MSKKVALVTGASSGIGFKTAVDLKNAGFIVYGAARRMDKLKNLEGKDIKIIQLDVTDEDSMAKCVETIIKDEGRLDVLVNNAGYGSFGAIEDVPIEEARRQIEVNVFGLARMCQLVLPHMRKNSFGRIINISSMGGKMYTSFGGWYHATKFAVEALSDCMRLETEQFGVDVVLVEPGGIKTDWGIIAAENLRKTSKGSAYGKSVKETAKKMRKNYNGNLLSDPKIISKVIVKAATAKKPKTRYLVGFGAKPAVFLRRILSDRMFDKLVKATM
ncbi:Short-chain dehydrogenase/reductase [Petrocella atlantisensis]|uniref:Short-chain dehydrogenase/reductase n=1 Tax=Petrocella atlantisensis TaxID=2173034 RepID=A0A3P7PSS4_9FIRM|nr:oxidoreductase [Petrocella atlantisensis]VDN47117.1 Short-chain dehydrogenase/reductase [Petrocella atlantisensis]